MSSQVDPATLYHEAGHAVAFHRLPACDGVSQVSVLGDEAYAGAASCTLWHHPASPEADVPRFESTSKPRYSTWVSTP